MKYYTFKIGQNEHFVAINPQTEETMEIIIRNGQAVMIKIVRMRPDRFYMKPVLAGEFYRAFVDASNQLYAHFRNSAGDIFPIPITVLGFQDSDTE